MPTPTGLPKPGEIWQRTVWPSGETIRFRVLSRSGGTYWSLRVMVTHVNDVQHRDPRTRQRGEVQLWVDASYWLNRGELTHLPNQGASNAV